MKKRVLVGLSGGVDSAVSAYLLKKAGYDVTAGFMINYLAFGSKYCSTLEDMEVAKEIAAYLDIPFFTFDYREEYEKKVLDYMYEGYRKGITPNPDFVCNSEIKFKLFLDEAISFGFDMIATGHYALVEEKNGIFKLKKGVDPDKDQSYFLAGLSQFQLSKSIFPIGHLKKSQVREIALKIGLPNATRKDSQGICFVGKVDLFDFLQEKIKQKPGKIVDTKGNVLGEHKGVFYYTIGQRRGLNIGGLKEPVFVVKKDIEKNELIVGTEKDLALYSDKLTISHVNILGEKLEFPLKAKAKIRYRQQDQDCLVSDIGNGRYEVVFQTPQKAVTPGQICAIYDESDYLVMSGVIE